MRALRGPRGRDEICPLRVLTASHWHRASIPSAGTVQRRFLPRKDLVWRPPSSTRCVAWCTETGRQGRHHARGCGAGNDSHAAKSRFQALSGTALVPLSRAGLGVGGLHHRPGVDSNSNSLLHLWISSHPWVVGPPLSQEVQQGAPVPGSGCARHPAHPKPSAAHRYGGCTRLGLEARLCRVRVVQRLRVRGCGRACADQSERTERSPCRRRRLPNEVLVRQKPVVHCHCTVNTRAVPMRRRQNAQRTDFVAPAGPPEGTQGNRSHCVTARGEPRPEPQ